MPVVMQVINRQRPPLPGGRSSVDVTSDSNIARSRVGAGSIVGGAGSPSFDAASSTVTLPTQTSLKGSATAAAAATIVVGMPASLSGQASGGSSLAQRPASLHALPELNDIIRACWQQRDLRRPTAAAVCAQLQALLHALTSS
jgi:hypothetical protein